MTETSPAPPRRLLVWCIFSTIVVFWTTLDLWSKHAVFELLDVEVRMLMVPRLQEERPCVIDQEHVVVIPGFFELEANFNYGAFSGWFAKHTSVLTIISAVAAGVIMLILFFALRQPGGPSLWFVTALGLICGGTLGNFYDRLTLQAVRDWIKWFFVWNGQPKVWPNFNIADSGICVGVGIIILLEVRNAMREHRKKKA